MKLESTLPLLRWKLTIWRISKLDTADQLASLSSTYYCEADSRDAIFNKKFGLIRELLLQGRIR